MRRGGKGGRDVRWVDYDSIVHTFGEMITGTSGGRGKGVKSIRYNSTKGNESMHAWNIMYSK